MVGHLYRAIKNTGSNFYDRLTCQTSERIISTSGNSSLKRRCNLLLNHVNHTTIHHRCSVIHLDLQSVAKLLLTGCSSIICILLKQIGYYNIGYICNIECIFKLNYGHYCCIHYYCICLKYLC